MIAVGLFENLSFRKADVKAFMESVDGDFIPPIASRVDLDDYVGRLVRKAAVFVAYRDNVIPGLAACYCNDRGQNIADLSYLAVHKTARKAGIGKSLMLSCLARAPGKHADHGGTKTPSRIPA